MLMELPLDFDPDKDRRNQVKHGMSLAAANRIEWETTFVWPDTRFDYGEERMLGLGRIGIDLFHVTFVDRAGKRRIISLRSATKQEAIEYVRYIAPHYPHSDRRRGRRHHRRRPE